MTEKQHPAAGGTARGAAQGQDLQRVYHPAAPGVPARAVTNPSLVALAREIAALPPAVRWQQLRLLRSAPPALRALARWRWALLCRAVAREGGAR